MKPVCPCRVAEIMTEIIDSCETNTVIDGAFVSGTSTVASSSRIGKLSGSVVRFIIDSLALEIRMSSRISVLIESITRDLSGIT